MSNDQAVILKHFQDALRGRVLSGVMAYEINAAICEGQGYKNLVNQGDKLPGVLKPRLQEIADRMIAEGVKPAESLLTPQQKRAMARRSA